MNKINHAKTGRAMLRAIEKQATDYIEGIAKKYQLGRAQRIVKGLPVVSVGPQDDENLWPLTFQDLPPDAVIPVVWSDYQNPDGPYVGIDLHGGDGVVGAYRLYHSGTTRARGCFKGCESVAAVLEIAEAATLDDANFTGGTVKIGRSMKRMAAAV